MSARGLIKDPVSDKTYIQRAKGLNLLDPVLVQ